MDTTKAQRILAALEHRGQHTIFDILKKHLPRGKDFTGGYRKALAELVLLSGEGVDRLVSLVDQWNDELDEVKKRGEKPYTPYQHRTKHKLDKQEEEIFFLLREARFRGVKSLDLVHILYVEFGLTHGFRRALMRLTKSPAEYRALLEEWEDDLRFHINRDENPYTHGRKPDKTESLSLEEAREAAIMLSVYPVLSLVEVLVHEFRVSDPESVLHDIARYWPADERNRPTVPALKQRLKDEMEEIAKLRPPLPERLMRASKRKRYRARQAWLHLGHFAWAMVGPKFGAALLGLIIVLGALAAIFFTI